MAASHRKNGKRKNGKRKKKKKKKEKGSKESKWIKEPAVNLRRGKSLKLLVQLIVHLDFVWGRAEAKEQKKKKKNKQKEEDEEILRTTNKQQEKQERSKIKKELTRSVGS